MSKNGAADSHLGLSERMHKVADTVECIDENLCWLAELGEIRTQLGELPKLGEHLAKLVGVMGRGSRLRKKRKREESVPVISNVEVSPDENLLLSLGAISEGLMELRHVYERAEKRRCGGVEFITVRLDEPNEEAQAKLNELLQVGSILAANPVTLGKGRPAIHYTVARGIPMENMDDQDSEESDFSEGDGDDEQEEAYNEGEDLYGNESISSDSVERDDDEEDSLIVLDDDDE